MAVLGQRPSDGVEVDEHDALWAVWDQHLPGTTAGIVVDDTALTWTICKLTDSLLFSRAVKQGKRERERARERERERERK